MPRYDDARQAGVWARATKREPNATPVARRLATISARHDLTVVSGLVAWCGPTERECATHFRPGAVPSELDFVLADGDARALVCGGGTDNGEAASWAFSHHRAVWVALSFEARRQPPPAPPRFPAARWRSADDAAREAYAADLDERLGDIVRALDASGTALCYRRLFGALYSAPCGAGRRRRFRLCRSRRLVNAHDLRRLAPGFAFESRAAAVHLARPAAAAASSRGHFHGGGRRLRLPATRAP